MTSPEDSAGQWTVTVRSSGEILTAAALEPSIELGLLGVPSGYTPPEIAGWLHDLIGVARETGREDARARPIPALLHHGLTGLLFSHAQLWNREGEQHPLSYAVVHAGGAVAFGWIGDASITARVAGEPVDLREVIVRDDEGHEARAFELPDSGAVDLRLEWASAGAQAVLEAHWPGPAPATADGAATVDTPVPMAPPAWFEAGEEEPVAKTLAPIRDDASPEAPAELRDAIETPEPYMTPAVPVVPMEGIERESFHPFGGPHPSFFDSESEPLDLDAPIADSAALHGVPQLAPAESTPAPAPPAESIVDPAPAPLPAQPAPPAPVHMAAVQAQAPAPAEAQPVAAPPRQVAELAAQAETEAAVDTMHEAHAAPEGEFEVAEEARPSRLRRMFARFAFWRSADAPDVAARAGAPLDFGRAEAAFDVPGVPDQVPPSPEPAHLTAHAVDGSAAGGELHESEDEVLVGADAAPAVERAASESRKHITAEAQGAPRPAAPGHAAPVRAAVSETPAAAATPPHAASPAAESAAQAPARARTPMRPQWPSAEEFKEPAPLWKRPWVWGVLMAALFAGGWIIGHLNDERRAGAARGVRNVLRTVGLGGAHFEVMVNSRPQGAWISVDGEDLARRTPASVELEPGEHQVTLSFSDLGAATFEVRGADGDRLTLEPPLWGAVQIYSSDQDVPVAVSVDGVPRGFAPLRVDSLTPGAHEVRFSGPGLPSWGQTVQVRVSESAELIARPMTSPATGVIEVRASMATETGTVDVEGAKVWLDGEPAGQTPLTLELPRGPHSIRVEYLGEAAPVQVIDLPGGNQRFASFLLRSGQAFATLTALDPPAVVPLDQPTVVSMALDGVQPTSVHEMWLHVQTPDGPWRRYQMAWLKATGGVVGVAVFPTTLFGEDGRARYYSSASTNGGDEYFSEVYVAARAAAATASRRR